MDIASDIQQQVADAIDKQQGLAISAGHSKDFIGGEITGKGLSVAEHKGVVDYDFRELVITARAGTTLAELNQVLADNGQMLPFEPPAFSPQATLGGTLACGLSGPRRPYTGSARDFLLGTKIINGKAEQLTFGGQVMKNVAGYDLSRLMVGAMGTLGVLLQASVKVLPRPATEKTTVLEKTPAEAIKLMNRLAGQNLPLSASAFYENRLYLRFSSFEAPVEKALASIGGELLAEGDAFWLSLKEQQLDFFRSDKTLWRLSVPPATPMLKLDGKTLYEWGGAQRWFISNGDTSDNQAIQDAVSLAGGHASQFRHGNRSADVFQALPQGLMTIHKQLKATMDPAGIFNPGRLYQAF